VESNSGKSNVTILSLFQALPTDLYSSNILSHEKEYRNQNEKMLFLASFLVIIIGFLVIAGLFRLHRMGWYLLVFCCLR
jgi:formate hydrogenlyase subunit 3/multisubunit Na+/H+ antiporter MnhD subunit